MLCLDSTVWSLNLLPHSSLQQCSLCWPGQAGLLFSLQYYVAPIRPAPESRLPCSSRISCLPAGRENTCLFKNLLFSANMYFTKALEQMHHYWAQKVVYILELHAGAILGCQDDTLLSASKFNLNMLQDTIVNTSWDCMPTHSIKAQD